MRKKWKDVVGYEGLYCVSNVGHLRSYPRMVRGRGVGLHRAGGRFIRPSQAGTVALSRAGKVKYFRIAQLVLRAFVGPPPSPQQNNARHLDDITSNNNLDNLAWGTAGDNYEDAVRNGSHGPGSPGAISRGVKLRGRKRPEVDTRRKDVDLLREQTNKRARTELGRFL